MLSTEGRKLFCFGLQQPQSCLKRVFRNLFHTDYDDQLHHALDKCRKSSKSLCAQFGTLHFEHRMDTSILHTLKVILSSKKPLRTYRFFLDIAKQSHRHHDHQTANVLCLALSNDALNHIKKPKNADEYLTRMKKEYGYPSYDKHVHYFDKARTQHVIPSVFAFSKFIKRKHFVNRLDDVGFALQLMEIYKYLQLDEQDVLPLYKLIDRQETRQLKNEINRLTV